jgi:metallo-beta-lactamase class B
MKTIAPFILIACLPFAASLRAQPPAAAPAKPDSPAVQALVDKAKKAGGNMWAEEAHFFCEAPRANSPADPPIEPTKIFDNVYVIGNQGTVVYVVQTSDGLLMIDSLAANEVNTQLLPGFQKLGLDPAKVKAIVVGHGHGDHFGGSPYFQKTYGSKVYIGAADWDLMENPPPGGKKGPPVELPKHDQIIVEGQAITLGDFTMMPVAIPGHTPGAMGFTFPVKDKGKTRMAALYGGTVLTPGIVSDQGLETYLKSAGRFKEEARKRKVEIEIQNHPLMDPIQVKLDKLKARKPGAANPFVVGQGNYMKFMDVIAACTEVNIARRKGL